MKLVYNWKQITIRAWSIRFIILAGICTGLEIALPFLEGILPVPTGMFAALSGLASCMALISRLVAQKSLHNEDDNGDQTEQS